LTKKIVIKQIDQGRQWNFKWGGEMTYVREVNSTTFGIELHRGDVTHIKQWDKFGHNSAVSTTIEDVISQGGTFAWPTTAATIEAISDDANDTAAGTGARTITVVGLDENWNEVTETLTMAGLSASDASTSQFIRVNIAYVETSGAYSSTTSGANAGSITIRFSGAGATLTEIVNGGESKGQSEAATFSVPANKSCLLYQIVTTVEAAKTAEINLWQRQGADIVSAPFQSKRIVTEYHGAIGTFTHDFSHPLFFPEKTDIWVSATLAAGTGQVEASMSMLVIDYSPTTEL
jgi:hypothetical protein